MLQQDQLEEVFGRSRFEFRFFNLFLFNLGLYIGLSVQGHKSSKIVKPIVNFIKASIRGNSYVKGFIKPASLRLLQMIKI